MTPSSPARPTATTSRCDRCGEPRRVFSDLSVEPCRPCAGAKIVGEIGKARAKVAKRAGQDAEDGLARQLEIAGYFDIVADEIGGAPSFGFIRQCCWGLYLPEPRGFASDFAFPASSLLVEIDGQAHSIKARRKMTVVRAQLASSIGWRMLTVLPEQVRDGTAIELVKQALNGPRAKVES